MPEFVEVEAYARTARPLVGSTITGIDLRDERLLRRAEEGFDAEAAHVHGVLGGAVIEEVRRIGKLLLLDVSGGHTASLTFGLRGPADFTAVDVVERTSAAWMSRASTRGSISQLPSGSGRSFECGPCQLPQQMW